MGDRGFTIEDDLKETVVALNIPALLDGDEVLARVLHLRVFMWSV